MTPRADRPTSSSADQHAAALRAVSASGPAADAALAELLEAPALGWGDLLEVAVDNRTFCLLADHLTRIPRPGRLSWHMYRLLASTLRTNLYKTTVFRREALRILGALHEADLPSVALQGIAVETRLYGGRGAREFSDIDVLLAPEHREGAVAVLHALGYRVPEDGRALVLPVDDLIVPRVTVDLAHVLAHTDEPDDVRQALARATRWPVPGHADRLPVLADLDALAHHLARAGTSTRWFAYADAVRSFHACAPEPTQLSQFSLPASSQDGWDRLRQEWPLLPADPLAALGDEAPDEEVRP